MCEKEITPIGRSIFGILNTCAQTTAIQKFPTQVDPQELDKHLKRDQNCLIFMITALLLIENNSSQKLE